MRTLRERQGDPSVEEVGEDICHILLTQTDYEGREFAQGDEWRTTAGGVIFDAIERRASVVAFSMWKRAQKQLKEILCSQVFMGPASGGHGGASEWRLWTDVPKLAREEASGHRERVTLRPGAKTSETFKEVVMAQLAQWENAQIEVMHSGLD